MDQSFNSVKTGMSQLRVDPTAGPGQGHGGTEPPRSAGVGGPSLKDKLEGPKTLAPRVKELLNRPANYMNPRHENYRYTSSHEAAEASTSAADPRLLHYRQRPPDYQPERRSAELEQFWEDIDTDEQLAEEEYFRKVVAGIVPFSPYYEHHPHHPEKDYHYTLEEPQTVQEADQAHGRTFRYRPSAYRSARNQHTTESREATAAGAPRMLPFLYPSKIERYPGRTPGAKRRSTSHKGRWGRTSVSAPDAKYAAQEEKVAWGLVAPARAGEDPRAVPAQALQRTDGDMSSRLRSKLEVGRVFLVQEKRTIQVGAKRAAAANKESQWMQRVPMADLHKRCAKFGVGCFSQQSRVPSLVTLCCTFLAAHLENLAELPPIPPKFVDKIIKMAEDGINRRQLLLLVQAGARSVRITDLWGICNAFPAGWRVMQERELGGVTEGMLVQEIPEYMVDFIDQNLHLSDSAWVQMLGESPTLEHLHIQSARTEEEDSPQRMKNLVKHAVKAPRLTSFSIAYFDGVYDSTLRPLLGVKRLTKLDLSHIPHVSDDFVTKITTTLTNLVSLRCDFLPVTDLAFRYIYHMTKLRSLEIRACPYVLFQLPFPFEHLRLLHTIKIDPPGGDTEMTLGAEQMQGMGVMPFIKTLVIGCKIKSFTKRGGKSNLDLRSISFKHLVNLELYNVKQVIFPKRLALWTTTLQRLTVNECEGIVFRIRDIPSLTHLHIVSCARMLPDEFLAIKNLTSLHHLVLGALPGPMNTLKSSVIGHLSRLKELHLHHIEEVPLQSTAGNDYDPP